MVRQNVRMRLGSRKVAPGAKDPTPSLVDKI